MTPGTLIALTLVTPLLGALAVAILGRNVDDTDRASRGAANLRDCATVVASLVTFGLVLGILQYVQDGVRPSLELFEVFPGVPLAFEVEPLGTYSRTTLDFLRIEKDAITSIMMIPLENIS